MVFSMFLSVHITVKEKAIICLKSFFDTNLIFLQNWGKFTI